MPEREAKDRFEYSVATVPPTRRQRQFAFVVVVVTLAAFGAVAPFASLPLQRFDSFIPAMATFAFVTDLVTAVLLFGQFSATGSRALLVLASGYLFSSLIAIPFALTFPGAFEPTGLLGAESQSAAWLSVSIRFGFAVATVGYALLLTSAKQTKGSIGPSPKPAILWSVALVIIVVCALTSVVTAGHDFMPRLMDGTSVLPFAHYANGMVALTYILTLLILWPRRKSLLDLWLIVAVCVLIAETVSVALFATGRFTLGFYANRAIPLAVSKVVLIVLLSETVILHLRLASAFMLQRRERDNRLMSVDAATAAIAHEINQPLAAISLNCSTALELVQRTPLDLEEVRACLKDSIDGTDRANDIVAGIRGLFKTAPHRSTMIEMNSIVRQVLRMVEHDLQVHGVSVSTNFQEDLPQIMADPTLLQQVILNLVKNAIEAMVAGRTAIKTLRLITTTHGNSGVSLSVQDSGPGINHENATHIFDPFFTTKSSGMGLGLSISQRIIVDHGGDLRLTKTSSSGCTFEITLPSVETSDSGFRRTYETSSTTGH